MRCIQQVSLQLADVAQSFNSAGTCPSAGSLHATAEDEVSSWPVEKLPRSQAKGAAAAGSPTSSVASSCDTCACLCASVAADDVLGSQAKIQCQL